jgi:hypothetical protein
MADLAISSIDTASLNTQLQSGQLGETIADGDIVYRDNTTGKWQLLDATILGAEDIGICIVGGVLDGVGLIQSDGYVTINAVATDGVQYYVSANPGKLCPRSDLSSGDIITLAALGTQTTTLAIHFHHYGIPVP